MIMEQFIICRRNKELRCFLHRWFCPPVDSDCKNFKSEIKCIIRQIYISVLFIVLGIIFFLLLFELL